MQIEVQKISQKAENTVKSLNYGSVTDLLVSCVVLLITNQQNFI
jgi:hypothetical protein